MGKFNIVLSVFGGMILAVLLLLSFVIPYVILPIAAALGSLVLVSIYFLKEDRSLSDRAAMKTFYCPFRKMIVEAKLRPSIFAYRTYDDVLKCSAFKDRVRCQKRCLNMPEFKSDPRPVAVLH
ncbi:MAG TPA: hypothetical protein VFJ67_03580 [Thermodesulfobacteriota bacterium]|nr:hypothetical protein [Thermodesulfobacteriota bacterium]